MSKSKSSSPLKQIAFNFDMFSAPEEPKLPVVADPEVLDTIQKQDEPQLVVPAKTEVIIDLTPKHEVKTATKTKSARGRMKLSDMAAGVEKVEVPDDEILFSKRYYSIGAVTEMFKVNHSLIRFWENEFDILKPKKNGKGDRLFRPEDIKNLKFIFHLLRERKYTIDGAKEFLKKNKLAEKKFEMIESMKSLRGFLLEMKAGL
jgi:DNA-binding transcriptional MerR regulator